MVFTDPKPTNPEKKPSRLRNLGKALLDGIRSGETAPDEQEFKLEYRDGQPFIDNEPLEVITDIEVYADDLAENGYNKVIYTRGGGIHGGYKLQNLIVFATSDEGRWDTDRSHPVSTAARFNDGVKLAQDEFVRIDFPSWDEYGKFWKTWEVKTGAGLHCDPGEHMRREIIDAFAGEPTP